MDQRKQPVKRIFSYEEAAALLPLVRQLTSDAVAKIEALADQEPASDELPESAAEYEGIVARWAESVIELGIEVKGLWLVDFDSGSGYYCWKYPEAGLQFFHDYESGFGGRVQLT